MNVESTDFKGLVYTTVQDTHECQKPTNGRLSVLLREGVDEVIYQKGNVNTRYT